MDGDSVVLSGSILYDFKAVAGFIRCEGTTNCGQVFTTDGFIVHPVDSRHNAARQAMAVRFRFDISFTPKLFLEFIQLVFSAVR